MAEANLIDIWGDGPSSAAAEPLTAEKIMESFKKYDASGSGIITPKQCLNGLKDLAYLGLSESDCKEKILQARKTCGDGKGNVNLIGFAYVLNSQLAVERAKKEAEAEKSADAKVVGSAPAMKEVVSNPFNESGGAGGGSSSAMVVKVSGNDDPAMGAPSPMDGGPSVDELTDAADPSAAIAIPSWWGHSLDSPMASENEEDDPLTAFGFDDDAMMGGGADLKMGKAKSMGPTLMQPPSNGGKSSSKKKKRKKSPSPRPVDFTFITNYSNGEVEQIVTPRTGAAKKKYDEKTSLTASRVSDSDDDSDDPFAKEKRRRKKGKRSRESDDEGDDDEKRSDKKSSRKKKKSSKRNIPKSARRDGERDHRGGGDGKSGDGKRSKKDRKRRPRTDAIAAMQKGSSMLKYGRHGFPHFRRFQLSKDCAAIQWFSSRKAISDTQIKISEIKNVIEGQQTEVFKQCNQSSLEKASFSIVYGSKMRTLDLVAKSHEEARLWIKGLSGLLRAQKQGKLHKVAQILVDVNYTDITELDYSGKSGKKSSAISKSFNDIEKLKQVETTLEQSRALYRKVQKSMGHKAVLEHEDYDSLQANVTGYENRFQEIEFALHHKTVMLGQLKRDVWVLKVELSSAQDQLASIKKGGKGGLLRTFGF